MTLHTEMRPVYLHPVVSREVHINYLAAAMHELVTDGDCDMDSYEAWLDGIQSMDDQDVAESYDIERDLNDTLAAMDRSDIRGVSQGSPTAPARVPSDAPRLNKGVSMNDQSSEQLFENLYEDMALLDSGEWVPDTDSIEATVDTIEEIQRRFILLAGATE